MPNPFDNPQNFIVPTAPPGTNNNRAASTAFVSGALNILTTTAVTVSAVKQLPMPTLPNAAVVITDPFTGGLFVWSALNLSSFVTADPGNGIYIAPISAPTGASGAWVRQYSGAVSWEWFGAVGDGVVTLGPPVHSIFGDYRSSYVTNVVSGTDNAPAWNNILPWARNESNNGNAVAIQTRPDSFNWDMANMNNPGFYGIKRLDFNGNGATFTNTNTSGSFLNNPWLYQAAPFVTGPSWAGDGVIPAGGAKPISFLINSTAIGDLSITLVTAARTSYFSVGEWVFIGSYDIQMSGYPPNMYYGDYAQITTINAGTGAIGVTTPLKYAHLSTFNDFTATGTIYPCGAARIWKLDTTGFGYGSVGTPWDLEHTYRNGTVNLPPAFFLPSAPPGFYTVWEGKRLVTENWNGSAWSQTITMESSHKRNHYWTTPETDKNIGHIDYEDCDFDFPDGAQSSSIESITYNNCRLGGIAFGAKQTSLTNCTVKPNIQSTNFNLSASQGMAGPVTLENCRLLSYVPGTITPGVLDAGSVIPASSDGSTPVTFSNGTLILNHTGSLSLLPSFHGVPGQYIALKPANNPGFAGDMAVGIVIGMRSDATNVYIDTTLQLASLPAWSLTGVAAQFNIFRATSTKFINCNGSDQARMVTAACDMGYDYWNLKQYTFNGTAVGGNLGGWLGSILWADIDVVWPSATSTDIITFTAPTYSFNGTAFVIDTGGTVITINCGVAGHRFISKAMNSGLTGTDHITVGGVTQNPILLPSGRTIADTAQWSASAFGSTIDLTPLIRATFAFDTGQARRLLTAQFNRTASGVILPTVGNLV